MNLRELIRRCESVDILFYTELQLFADEILEKAQKAWQDAQKGCIPCQGASAAYMDILGSNDPTEQLKEVKISLSPKK